MVDISTIFIKYCGNETIGYIFKIITKILDLIENG